MTGPEHILAWIELSGPHYARLLKLQEFSAGPRSNALMAGVAHNLASDAYAEMVRGGDAYAEDFNPVEILQAAIDLLNWSAPE